MRPDLNIPEDPHTEKGLLASICWEGADLAEVVAYLRDEDFMVPAHRWIFRALRSLVAENQAVNALTIRDVLIRMDALDKVGGYASVVDVLNGDCYDKPMVLAEILRRKADLRGLIHFGSKLADTAATEQEDPTKLVIEASNYLASVLNRRPGKGLGFIGDIGSRAMEAMDAVREGRRKPGVPTGLPRLDSILGGGFKPGQVIVLAARPGMGKTTLAMDWARRTAALHGPAAVWSLEMGAEELWTRLACAEAGVDSQKASSGFLGPVERGRLEDARDSLAQTPLLVNDQATISIPEIRAQFDRSQAQMGKINLAVIDYLQLLTGPDKKGQSDASRVAEISRSLKLFAKDAGVPLLVLSQLNREIEKRAGGRPQLSDLRDSGAIEQDSDIVIFLHRKPGCADNEAELHLAKHRNGPQAIIPLAMDLQHYRFRELERLTAGPAVEDFDD